jgi:tetratricopeptide (TPR) repeat protein
LSVFCDKIIEAGWLAAVVLTPLFFNIYSSRVFEPDKITLLRSVALVMIAAWIIRTIEEFTARARGKTGAPENSGGKAWLFNGVTWRTPLVLPTLVLVVVYVIATAFSITPRTSLLGSYQRLQGTYTTFSYIIVFLMILMNMRHRRQLDRLVTAIVMTSLPIAFYGILQRVDRDPLPWGGDVTQRVAANMGNAIFIAAYLIMAFFLTLGRTIEAFRVILTEEESRLSDILRASAYIFVGAVQLIAFAFAGSRGPLLGWLPGMFILGLVGLLMLRVTLHRVRESTSPGEADSGPSVERTASEITGLDVLKAVLLSFTSLLSAGAAFFLALNAFPGRPQVELAAVAALIGGLIPLLILAGVQRSAARWLWASWIFFSIIGAVLLFLVNFSDHPRITELRTSGAFGSLGTLFESEGGTGRVRTLIWEGAVNLVRAHEPITFPDGTSDPFNGVRTLVGYGPESMYVAYNRFYPPDLAHYEARNASPDRSHNETWDSLVITGVIGFLAEQFLFLSVFYFALKFIGWVPNRRASILLIAMMILGGIAGAIGLLVIKDVSFIGTGWPGGATIGIVAYVISFALFHFKVSARVYALLAAVIILIIGAAIFGATFTSPNRWLEIAGATALSIVAFSILYVVGRWAFGATAGEPIAIGGHVFLIIALFGGMLAHYLEISLAGIAIVATRTYFWTYAATLVVAGLNWVPTDEPATAPVAAARPAPGPVSRPPPAAVPRSKKRKAVQPATRIEPRPSLARATPPWIGSTIAMALIGALVLSMLGFDFINTPPIAEPSQLPRDPTQVLWNSLTRLPYKDDAQSIGVLLMFFVTWLFGAVVSLTELRRRNIITPANQWRAAGLYAGVSIAFSFAYWIFHASGLLNVIGTLFALNAGSAASIDEYMGRFIAVAEGMAGLLGLFYVMVFAAMILIALSLYGEVRARALPLASEWGLIAGVPIAAAALAMVFAFNYNSIRADIIYKQGAPYVANNACDGTGQPISQCDIAIAHLKQALRHAPDEDFYMLALGASFLNKSAASTDEGSPLLIESSTYDSVFNLNAERTSQLNRRDALTAARVTLERARQVNPLNTDHSANLARLHRRWSDLAGSTDERRLRLDQSNKFYEQATNLSPNNAQLWNEWALVHFALYELASQLGDTAAAQAALDEAGNKLDRSLSLDQEFADTYFYLASLYTVRNEPEKAQVALEQALRLNPSNVDAWERLTDQLIASSNYTEAERLTLEFVSHNPTYLRGWRKLAQGIYLPQGRLAEAANATQRALEQSGQDPEHWLDQAAMAQIFLMAGDPAAALPYAQTAVQLAPPERQADAQAILDAVQAALSGSSQSPLP